MDPGLNQSMQEESQLSELISFHIFKHWESYPMHRQQICQLSNSADRHHILESKLQLPVGFLE